MLTKPIKILDYGLRSCGERCPRPGRSPHRPPPIGRPTPRPSHGRSGSPSFPAREPSPPLRGSAEADLCIVGGGFTGLWAALQAKADDPGRDVVLLEAGTIGCGASGRNGGFLIGSLTHGLENGLARFGDEIELLERLGRENLSGLVADIERHGIECELEMTGELTPSVAAYQDEWAAETAAALRPLRLRRRGLRRRLRDARRGRFTALPRWCLGQGRGRRARPGEAGVGLFEAARAAGVRVHEGTPVMSLETAGDRVTVRTPAGSLSAHRVLVGTSAYPSPVREIRHYVAPVYDYALMSEPLSPAQLKSIGWRRRQGIGDGGNRFHYYRLSADDRILWGGFDAVYRYGGPVRPDLDQDDATFVRLAQNFRVTFPQLADLRFTYRWGGAIDTCSRFSVFFGTTHGGRVAYATGYTGLGVASTRFGARVGLDLLDGRETEATRSRYVRRKPLPFPPEPLRSAVIQLTRNRLAAADRRDGRRGFWLGMLDRLGLGFDS